MHLPLLQISDSIQGMANSIWRCVRGGGRIGGALGPQLSDRGDAPQESARLMSVSAPLPLLLPQIQWSAGPQSQWDQFVLLANTLTQQIWQVGRAAAPALHWQPPSACISRGALREPPCCADAWASPPDPCRSSP